MERLVFIASMLISGLANAQLTIHEWGTFTSFMGADGVLQQGLHHEEEPLPDFVYGVRNTQEQGISLFDPTGILHDCEMTKVPCDMMNRLQRNSPANESMPRVFINSGITQKMETPVIYFYGTKGQKVNLTVEFPKGIISQYYPRASRYTPKLKDVKTLGNAKFEFDVQLLGKNDFNGVPRTQKNSVYLPARDVPAANSVLVNGDRERFIFYRGVGNFALNLKISSPKGNQLVIQNSSKKTIPTAFVINTDGHSLGSISEIGAIGTSKTTEIPTLKSGLPYNAFINQSENMITKALVDSGLYPKEALAFFNTWKKSYFNNPGTRVLYILPRVETDRILPLHVKQPVKELVRTIVGRIEVMSADEENTLLNGLINGTLGTDDLGRFVEPKLRRLRVVAAEKITDTNILNKVNHRIESLMLHP